MSHSFTFNEYVDKLDNLIERLAFIDIIKGKLTLVDIKTMPNGDLSSRCQEHIHRFQVAMSAAVGMHVAHLVGKST